jgi:rhodanese-related sulfurtransferase
MEHIGQFIINHWTLWSALLVILLLIFINEFITQKNRAKELSTASAVELINHEDAVVVDLRDQETYRSGRIINAIHAAPEDFGKPKLEKYKSKPIILVCARGLQSPALAIKLRQQGYGQVMVLSGGMAAWQSAGLPLVKGKG